MQVDGLTTRSFRLSESDTGGISPSSILKSEKSCLQGTVPDFLLRIQRALAYVLCLVAALSAPGVIPRLGIDYPYFFIMALVLFAWFTIKWGAVKKLANKSNFLEILLGSMVVIAVYVLNLAEGSVIGLVDLILIFAGVTLSFYGFRAFKLFWVPTLYGVVLLLGYQLENILPAYTANLQDWMAGVMASSMRIIGIQASASGYVVSMNSTAGPLLLSVEGDCTGIQGILAFGMLSTLAVLDIKAKLSRLLPLFVLGFIGAFLINIVRLFGVFLTFEYLGVALGSTVHVYLGYILFIVWVMVFWAIAFRYLLPATPSHLGNAGSPPPGLNDFHPR